MKELKNQVKEIGCGERREEQLVTYHYLIRWDKEWEQEYG
jgi:hypothetical protein